MNNKKITLSPIQNFYNTLENRKKDFVDALPKNISWDKFSRVVKTSVISNPDLLQADIQSLLLSCFKCAQDGLLPDGRESAFVVFNAKKNNTWVKLVQYLPMYQGILKKIRNSGELLSISTHVVYKTDNFELILGDDEHIKHMPDLDSEQNNSDALCVYCIVKTKDGGIYREIMSVKQINKIRDKSKAYTPDKNCIWSEHWEEMAKKTIIRKIAKRLPMSTDLDLQDDDYQDTIKIQTTESTSQISNKFVPVIEQQQPVAQITETVDSIDGDEQEQHVEVKAILEDDGLNFE